MEDERRVARRDFVPPIGLNWEVETPDAEDEDAAVELPEAAPEPLQPVEWAPPEPQGDGPPFP